MPDHREPQPLDQLKALEPKNRSNQRIILYRGHAASFLNDAGISPRRLNKNSAIFTSKSTNEEQVLEFDSAQIERIFSNAAEDPQQERVLIALIDYTRQELANNNAFVYIDTVEGNFTQFAENSSADQRSRVANLMGFFAGLQKVTITHELCLGMIPLVKEIAARKQPPSADVKTKLNQFLRAYGRESNYSLRLINFLNDQENVNRLVRMTAAEPTESQITQEMITDEIEQIDQILTILNLESQVIRSYLERADKLPS